MCVTIFPIFKYTLWLVSQKKYSFFTTCKMLKLHKMHYILLWTYSNGSKCDIQSMLYILYLPFIPFKIKVMGQYGRDLLDVLCVLIGNKLI